MKNAWRSLGAGAAVIFLLTVVAYIPALRAGFVFDDTTLITDNQMVKAGDSLYRFWLTTEPPDYYPLTWSLWWLEWRLWGNRATGYHVVNVLLHAINAVLVWLVLRRLKIPGAWLAGLMFAVHPVNAATVAWISEQKNTLSMLFFLIAILLYLKFDEEGRWRWYSLSLMAFLLALFSKTAVVMLPVVLLLCVWWLRGRVRWEDFFYSMPFFVLSMVSGLITIWFQHHRALVGHTAHAARLAERLAAAGWVPWFYLYKALLPFQLTVVYPKWEIDASRWTSYVPGALVIAAFALFSWKRKTWGRSALFGLGYFVVTLFPVLGFFYQGFNRFSWVADHWQYISIVGVIALAVATGELFCSRLGKPGRLARTVAGAAVTVLLGVATWMRGGVYANDVTLWRDNVAKNQAVWPYNNLGCALIQTGSFKDAIWQFEQALRIDPGYAEAHGNLGNALLQAGRFEDAMGQSEEALRLKPDYAEAHYDLGIALVRLGKMPEAMAHWEQALRLRPDHIAAHNDLANALLQLGRTQEAIGHYEQALRLKPEFATAHNNLGIALTRLGRVQEAIAHFEQALQISPDYLDAHYNLGVDLERVGRTNEAVAHYEQALRIKPDYAEAQKRLERLRAVR